MEKLAAVVVGLLVLVGLSGCKYDPYAPVTRLVLASADATTDASVPALGLGEGMSLSADAEPSRVAYLRFAVAGLVVPVTKAVLRLHVQNSEAGPSPSGGTIALVTDHSWTETGITWTNRPTVGAAIASTGEVFADTWVDFDVTAAVVGNGDVGFAITSTDPDEVTYDSRESGLATAPELLVTTHAPPQVLLAAGDIAGCTWNSDEATARILDANPQGTVAVLGDAVYPDATEAQFEQCYGPTWGRHLARTRPAVGNHEYYTDDANPYWDYFGAAAGERGKGWYSYDLGAWHIVALNSLCWEVGGCQAGSAQEQWLRADLAASTAPCTLAYWHTPLFTSVPNNRDPSLAPLWQALYDAGAEVVLNGHAHAYERFAPQTPDGAADADRGIREFTVGTGGSPYLYGFGTPAANSEVRENTTHGVLKLILGQRGYTWEFLPVEGKTFTDSGSGTCH